jgi:hypothetical protein
MYEPLIACLKTKGIGAFFQKPEQLVVSAHFPNFPSSNSFWVTRYRDDWYLSTWSPCVYRIPKEQNICEVCASILESSQEAIYQVDKDSILRFGLEELSEHRADSLMEQIFGSTREDEAAE